MATMHNGKHCLVLILCRTLYTLLPNFYIIDAWHGDLQYQIKLKVLSLCWHQLPLRYGTWTQKSAYPQNFVATKVKTLHLVA